MDYRQKIVGKWKMQEEDDISILQLNSDGQGKIIAHVGSILESTLLKFYGNENFITWWIENDVLFIKPNASTSSIGQAIITTLSVFTSMVEKYFIEELTDKKLILRHTMVNKEKDVYYKFD